MTDSTFKSWITTPSHFDLCHMFVASWRPQSHLSWCQWSIIQWKLSYLAHCNKNTRWICQHHCKAKCHITGRQSTKFWLNPGMLWASPIVVWCLIAAMQFAYETENIAELVTTICFNCFMLWSQIRPNLLKFLAMLVSRTNCWPAQSLATCLDHQSIMLLLTFLKSTPQCDIYFLSLVHQKSAVMLPWDFQFIAAPVSLGNRTDPLQVKIEVQMNDFLHTSFHKTCLSASDFKFHCNFDINFFLSGALSREIATWFIFRSNIRIMLRSSAKKSNIATLFSFMLQHSGRVGNSWCKNSIRPLCFKHASPQLQ